jgi:hypothetical protein
MLLFRDCVPDASRFLLQPQLPLSRSIFISGDTFGIDYRCRVLCRLPKCVPSFSRTRNPYSHCVLLYLRTVAVANSSAFLSRQRISRCQVCSLQILRTTPQYFSSPLRVFLHHNATAILQVLLEMLAAWFETQVAGAHVEKSEAVSLSFPESRAQLRSIVIGAHVTFPSVNPCGLVPAV